MYFSKLIEKIDLFHLFLLYLLPTIAELPSNDGKPDIFSLDFMFN